MKRSFEEITALIKTVKTLRSENGCPWDKKQTTVSLRPFLIEEFEEIVQAIDAGDTVNLCEELGDFLYLIIMVSEINETSGFFSLHDVIKGINKKLIRRHPHVFSGAVIKDEGALRDQWNEIKAAEKANKYPG